MRWLSEAGEDDDDNGSEAGEGDDENDAVMPGDTGETSGTE